MKYSPAFFYSNLNGGLLFVDRRGLLVQGAVPESTGTSGDDPVVAGSIPGSEKAFSKYRTG